MTTEQFGRYEIRKRLGKGGMATVYLAYDPRFDREVALKVLPEVFLHNDTFRQRFEREARIIARLEHKAIVPVYDFGEHRSQPYLVMRHMAGDSLATRLEQRLQLNSNEILKIIQRIASALDEAHRHGIVHRDLKPGNILFDQYGDAYLADFGIAKLGEATASLTGNTVVGTPAYMSPEQVHGRKTIDGRSDIYTLGIILYELLTGQVPYRAETPVQQMMAHVLEPVPELPVVDHWDMPEECSGVVKKALSKEPDSRHKTASELAKELSEALQIELDAIDEVDRAPIPTPIPTPTPGGTVLVRPLGEDGRADGVDESQFHPTEIHPSSMDDSVPTVAVSSGPLTEGGRLAQTVASPPAAKSVDTAAVPPVESKLPKWAIGAMIGLGVAVIALVAFFVYPMVFIGDDYERGFIDFITNIEMQGVFRAAAPEDAELLYANTIDSNTPYVEYFTPIPEEELWALLTDQLQQQRLTRPEPPRSISGTTELLFIGISQDRALQIFTESTEDGETIVRAGITDAPLPPSEEREEREENESSDHATFREQFLNHIDPSLRPLFIFPPGSKIEETDVGDPLSPLLEFEIYRPAGELAREFRQQLGGLGLKAGESHFDRVGTDNLEEIPFTTADGRLFIIELKEDPSEGETKVTMFFEEE